MPDRDFAFGHRLPTDAASQIRNTATPAYGTDHTHRRALVALVLAVGVTGGIGTLVALPPVDAQALRVQDCGPGWVTDGIGHLWADEAFPC
jgi:hypothetical protein